jgi:hypothetical protein
MGQNNPQAPDDLLARGCQVIDPSQNLSGVRDIAIARGQTLCKQPGKLVSASTYVVRLHSQRLNHRFMGE